MAEMLLRVALDGRVVSNYMKNMLLLKIVHFFYNLMNAQSLCGIEVHIEEFSTELSTVSVGKR